ncbi:MAG: TonB-dependent receptor [Myxococcota bacterium]|nr:TonB-dependent receptor [Myxococcota bacterium]MDW8362055.1 TonB-dependent receptor [Myxococcales bacterium]
MRDERRGTGVVPQNGSVCAGLLGLLSVLAVAQTTARAQAPAETNEAAPASEPSQPPSEAEPPAEADAVTPEETGGEADPTERPRVRRGTGIEGRLVDASTGEPIIEGAVTVLGRGRRVYTNLDGYFAIDLPPGRYDLRAHYELYQPTRVDDVVVERGRVTEVEIRLTPDTESVEQEIVVEARADTGTEATQLSVRREAVAVRDAVSAQEIQRSPDASAGDAARRVVAATTFGSYLFVRGLGGRYTNVLLGGMELPGTDPDVPGVQLDLFPAALLSSLAIVKTFTPDVPGSFAGGSMVLETRDFPSRFRAGANLSLGWHDETTFRDGLVYEGGGLDAFGFDDGTRALPDAVPRTRLDVTERLSAEHVTRIARTFSNTWGVTRQTNLPDLRLGAQVGDTVTLGERFLGYQLGLSFGRNTRNVAEDVVRLTQSGGRIVPIEEEDLDARSTNQQTSVALLGSATLEIARGHEMGWTSLLTHVADDYAAFVTGYDENRGQDIARRSLRWIERTVGFHQLRGDHRGLFGRTRLQWRASLATASRDEPDTRDLVYLSTGTGYRWFAGPGSGTRFFSELDQIAMAGAAEVQIPFGAVELRGGAFASRLDRTYEARRFRYERESGGDPAVLNLPPERLFAPENVGVHVRLREFTNPADSYEAHQRLYAAWTMLDLGLLERRLRLAAGIRGEALRQLVSSRSPFADTADPATETRRTDVDPLPAASATVRLGESSFVRASYGLTVARPQIRELAPFVYEDFIRRRNVSGNPALRSTRIHNLDLRVEHFPSSDEVLAVSVFAKLFRDPIEEVIVDFNNSFTFENVEAARNFGAEFEARIGLDRLSDVLDWLSVGANFTYVFSRVRLNEEQAARATSRERPLAGQSPYVANVSLGVTPPDARVSLFAYYNVFGRRLTEVGRSPLPDIFQEPFHAVDLVARWDLAEGLSLKATARNLLLQRERFRQGGITVRAYDPGTTASLQLSWSH